jgi:5-methylcytosine-specific restriction endonuclease McrA
MPRHRFCLGCRALISSGVRCRDCDAEYVRRRNLRPEHLARMAMPRAQRQRVLKRDGHRCTEPGCGVTTDLTIEHDPPVVIGLRQGKHHWRDDELRVLCRPCNSRLGGALSHA